MRLCFFTLASRNYLAYAATLMQSVRAAHPGSDRIIGLVDTPPAGDDAATAGIDLAAEILPVGDIGIPDFPRMAFRYDVMEMNTAVKPFYFHHLMTRRTADLFVYLDPDILVLRPLDAVAQRVMGGAEMVLIPHLTAPLDDDKQPDEIAILQSGAYNLGFLALADRPATRDLLAWWSERLTDRCLADPPNGLFVDQRWMDLAPSLVERTAILRHPGYDVAYWNIGQRAVSRAASDGVWQAGGEPLVFFHFSGVVPDDPSVFSKHQNRFAPSDIGPAAELLAEYLGRLHANRWRETRAIAYGFGRFASGRPVHRLMRASFRAHEAELADHPDPFATLADWFDAPDPEFGAEAPLTRLMVAAWRARSDLGRLFDPASPRGRLGLARWFAERATPELAIDGESLARAAAINPAPAGTDRLVSVTWRTEAGETGRAVGGLAGGMDGVQEAVIVIPPLADPLVELALHPLDAAGVVALAGISLSNHDGGGVWHWDANADSLAPVGGLTFADGLPAGLNGTLALVPGPEAALAIPAPAALAEGGRLVCRLRLASPAQLVAIAGELAATRRRLDIVEASLETERAARAALLASLSWRITRPLRAVRRLACKRRG